MVINFRLCFVAIISSVALVVDLVNVVPAIRAFFVAAGSRVPRKDFRCLIGKSSFGDWLTYTLVRLALPY